MTAWERTGADSHRQHAVRGLPKREGFLVSSRSEEVLQMGLAGKVKLPAAENKAIRHGEQGTCGLRVAHSCRLVHLAGTPGRGLLLQKLDRSA